MADSLDLRNDSASRRTIFLVALLLIGIPPVQTGVQIWPLQVDSIQWRFAATNAISSILLLPFIGLSLLLVAARILGYRGLARTIGTLTVLSSIALLASLGVFLLDTLELRAIVSSQMTAQFTKDAIRVASIIGIFFASCIALAILAFSKIKTPARHPKQGASASADSSTDLIVGR